MFKSLAVGVSLLALMSGCVSVGAPTPPPSTAPSLGITTPAPATPTRQPTVAVTPSPTAAPTATPTLEPTATPTVEPTVEPTATPEPIVTPPPQTNDALFFDEMDDPTSGWNVFSGDLASIAYAEGAVRITIHQDPAYAYSERDLGGELGVALVAAQFKPEGQGSAGLLCLATGEGGVGEVAYGAVFTPLGTVIFVRIENSDVEVLERNDTVGIELPTGETTLFGLACAGTATGALRLVVFGTATGPMASYQTDTGPEGFYAVGVYGESIADGYVLDVEAALAYGIPGSVVSMSPEGQELLTHVPPDWQQFCIESPTTENEVASVVCFLQQDGTGVELATYESYASTAEMDAAYAERVNDYGVQSTGDCQIGPNEGTWSVEGEQLGRLQCAPQKVGIRVDWTDSRLGILSTLVDFEGDYGVSYDTWLNAGPNP